MRPRTRLLLIALSLGALASCEDGTGPRVPRMIYTLRSIDGEALPTRPLPGVTHRIVSHVLVFEAGAGGTERRILRPDDGRPDLTIELPFQWRRTGSTLEMWAFCFGTGIVPCPPQPSLGGSTDGRRWVVTESDRYRTPSIFERIP